MIYDEVCLQKLHQTELEILDVIDAFCHKHKIPYSLYAGSLLGAVRHQDFIPWDDDLDICMTRDDYERFLRAWEADPQDGFVLQNKENSPRFSQSFSKIRKDNTAFLIEPELGAAWYHTGIFVDIFPLDRMPKTRWKRYIFLYRCMKYQLYTRGYIPEQEGVIVRTVSSAFLRLVPKSRRTRLRQILLQRITKYRGDETLPLVGIESVRSLKHSFSPDMMEHFTALQFGKRKYMCVADWDAHLKSKFGDYMQLPPEEEHIWTHQPVLIDFEHNYDVLLAEGIT